MFLFLAYSEWDGAMKFIACAKLVEYETDRKMTTIENKNSWINNTETC